MGKCLNCKELISEEMLYCPHCGTKLGEENIVNENVVNNSNESRGARYSSSTKKVTFIKKENAEKLRFWINICCIIIIVSMVVIGLFGLIIFPFIEDVVASFIELISVFIIEVLMFFVLKLAIIQRDFYDGYCSHVNAFNSIQE